MRTLVLDQGYQPHRVIDWKRAICMLFEGKVEVIEEYDEEIRSVTIVIKMPAVVRLLRKVTRRKSIKFSRMNVAARDKFRCQYCKRKLPLRKLTYDHVVPRSKGGKTRWENIVSACYPCNERKSNKTPEEAGMKLLREPEKPRSLPVVALNMDAHASIPDQWASWVFWHGGLDQD